MKDQTGITSNQHARPNLIRNAIVAQAPEELLLDSLIEHLWLHMVPGLPKNVWQKTPSEAGQTV